MKYKIMIILTIICVVGCNKKEKKQLPIKETTPMVSISNTEYPDYAEYRKEWKRVNADHTDGYKLVDGKIEKEIVEIQADDMSFKEIFSIQHRAHGEGHVFWWKGNQYTTDLKAADDEE